MMKITRIYTGEDEQSHFEEIVILCLTRRHRTAFGDLASAE